MCDTTPRHALVATNELWRVTARAWHEPPADTCSMVSASPSHPRLIEIIIPDFPCFSYNFLWDIASLLERTVCTGKPVTAKMSQSGSTGYTKPVRITALMSSTLPQPCKRRKNATLRPTMNKPTYGTTSERMISVTPSRMSWTLLEPEDRNTSADCFTTTTRNIPCFQFGTANTNSILWRGPKHTRTSSRKVSFH